MNKKQEYHLNNYKLKSFLEYYFALWLNELVELGYVDKWTYEETTYPLFEGLKLPYKKQMATKVKDSEEHIFAKASYTEDFSIFWNNSSKNIFYLDPSIATTELIKDIPFRLCNPLILDYLVSHVDVKSTNASTTSSSVSQPYKAKWVYDKYGILIHKIYPFSLGKVDYKKTLFYKTFIPKEVLKLEVYKRDSKWGKKNASKIKFETRSLESYLKIRGYE
jgi:hypothetical protein